jgi:hypothetical protein
LPVAQRTSRTVFRGDCARDDRAVLLDKRLTKFIGKPSLPSFLFKARLKQPGLQQIREKTLMFTPLNVRGSQLQRLCRSRVSTRA